MAKKWLPHGKWTKFLVGLHYYTIASFILLMATGIALFVPALHTILIPWLPLIYRIHILLGLVFGATLISPFFPLLPNDKWIRRLDWWFPMVFGIAIVFTGILLWKVTWFPTTWRSASFWWHGRFSYVLGAWIVVHAAYKAMGVRPASDGINPRFDPQRRVFLRWMGTGFTGAALLTIVDPFGRINAVLKRTAPGVESGGFAEYYTVVGTYPNINLEDYRLRVDGLVTSPADLSWAELAKLPAYRGTDDFHCVTGWSVPNVAWTGVHLQSLVKAVKPLAMAKYVHFYSSDGAYTESLSMQEALDPTVMLAYQLNGKPLIPEQGYPLRLVVPKMYGYKSIKWVNRIEFSDTPLQGYWEVRGYPNEAYIGQGM